MQRLLYYFSNDDPTVEAIAAKKSFTAVLISSKAPGEFYLVLKPSELATSSFHFFVFQSVWSQGR